MNDMLKQTLEGIAVPIFTKGLAADEAESVGRRLLDAGMVNCDGWALEWKSKPVGDGLGMWDIRFSARRTGVTLTEAAIGVEFRFDSWSVENYVFAPGIVYAGNRFRMKPMDYPVQYVMGEDLGSLDMPVTCSAVAHLEQGAGESRFSVNTADVTTPALGFHSRAKGVGFLVLTPSAFWGGAYGLECEESPARDAAVLRITAPSLRPSLPGYGADRPSGDRPVAIRTGETLEIVARVYVFEAPDIKAFVRQFCGVRKAVTGMNRLANVYPHSAAFADMEQRFLSCNWHEDSQFIGLHQECKGDHVWGFLGEWWTGWCFGGLALPVMAGSGTTLSRERALRTMDTIFSKIQAPSGLFYANYAGGKPVGDFWWNKGEDPNTCLIRRQGDMIHSLIKTIQTLQAYGHGEDVKSEWSLRIRATCDALVRIWRTYGQLGQFIDVSSETILVGGSTCGASVMLGLSEAGAFFGQDSYLAAARDMGAFFDEKFLAKGFTCGGPAEAGQAPDSESSFALVEGYWALYEATQEPEWLTLAGEAADLFTTWCVSHDYRFPPGSFFERADIRTAGSVWASSQNRHSAPGICTASGDVLLKLFRATGELRYLELAQDIAHNITQYISRKECLFPMQEPTWVNERVNISDWEGRDKVGEMIFRGSCWCENSCLLTFLDFPGIYVMPDRDAIHCFDHVLASRIVVDGRPMLAVDNPTRHAATVRILSEDPAGRARPYGPNLLRECPQIHIEPGKRVVVPLKVSQRHGERSRKLR